MKNKIIKWEDLKNERDFRVDLRVSLNGTEYRLSYFTNNNYALLTDDVDLFLDIENEIFFNSLRLTVIQE